MELLERYLQAVRFFLPARQQDDIVRELSENLVSQMEDREEELGRPLTEDEQADVLRRHGHPMLVAGRYRARQQLIGPALFPVYLFALKLGIAASLLLTVVIAVITALVTGEPARHFEEALLAFPGRALMVFAWTTLGFAAVDLMAAQTKIRHAWDPRQLPKVVRRDRWISRGNALAELFFSAAVLVWLLLIPGSPHLLFGPAARAIQLAPVWATVYVPMLLVVTAGIALALVNVMRPYWTPLRSLARIGTQLATLGIVGVLLRAHLWVTARAGATLPNGAPLDASMDLVNRAFQVGLSITALMCLIEIGRHAYRIYSRRRGPASNSAHAEAAR